MRSGTPAATAPGANVSQIASSAARRRRLVIRATSTADGVALHAARIRGGLQQAVLATHCANAAERPVVLHHDTVAACAQLGDDLRGEASLDLDLPPVRV